MEFLSEYGLFLAKTVTFVAAFLFIAGGIASLAQRQQGKQREINLDVTPLHKRYKSYRQHLEEETLEEDALKHQRKMEAKEAKEKAKARKKALKQGDGEALSKPRVFVLDFDGDLRASEVDTLRETVTSVLTMATPRDEIVLRLESPGGMVHSYGLAASQLARIRDQNVPLTVCVDKVAASGGYLMACLANRIIAAPFAIIGSIGVVAQMPNFNRLLKKHEIDFEVLTAGEYKRTLTLFGENTDKGREKFQEDLNGTHELFKEWVASYRPELDIDEVSKGEIWYGKRAVDLKLVDEVRTSDDYLVSRSNEADIFQVKCTRKQNLAEKLGIAAATVLDKGIVKLQKSWLSRSA